MNGLIAWVLSVFLIMIAYWMFHMRFEMVAMVVDGICHRVSSSSPSSYESDCSHDVKSLQSRSCGSPQVIIYAVTHLDSPLKNICGADWEFVSIFV